MRLVDADAQRHRQRGIAHDTARNRPVSTGPGPAWHLVASTGRTVDRAKPLDTAPAGRGMLRRSVTAPAPLTAVAPVPGPDGRR